MPVTKSARKQVRVSARRHARNKSAKSQVKTSVKKAQGLISAGAAAAPEAVVAAISTLDKAAEKGLIHKNAAARRKSRLMKKLNQAPPPATPETRGPESA
ncbi:MAG: 30S ribosomal protein S20 [Chloroflexi bacterium]|nr:30S ribosomal protein S20 [Chloroflexota bacterium]